MKKALFPGYRRVFLSFDGINKQSELSHFNWAKLGGPHKQLKTLEEVEDKKNF